MKPVATITHLSHNAAATTEYCTVLTSENNNFVVQSAGNIFTAIAAFSCVIRPEPGDRVMCSFNDSDENYILAVLQRASSQPAVMQFASDVNMTLPNGKISITARDGINMASTDEIGMLSSKVKIGAAKADISIDKLNATGTELTGNIRQIRIFADTVDTIAESLTQRTKNFFRWVEQVEQITAGDMLQTVRNLLNVRSRQAIITAKQDVKIDAERVHMG